MAPATVPAILSGRGRAEGGPLDTVVTDARATLLSLKDAAAALGLRPATVKQYIQKGQLAAVRIPCGNAIRLFVARAEIERYRHASLGGQGWTNRRAHTPPAPATADRSC